MKTVAVFFGGRSAEHDVSIVTALSSIIKPLELCGKYQVEPIYISKNGSWHWDAKLKDIKLFTSGGIEDFLNKDSGLNLSFNKGFQLEKPARLGQTKKLKIDIAFPAMHGTYGEDGSLMGLLEMAGVAYVGCNLASSVIAMDKIACKKIISASDILTSKFYTLTKNQVNNYLDQKVIEIEEKLKYPFFVKPSHLGSSIGINRVTNTDELRNALEVAAHYDNDVLVEEEVQNLIEVTLPIMGNDKLTPALLERPLIDAEDFFDFDTKYLSGHKKGGQKAPGKKGVHGSQGYSELPAKLSESLYKKATETALNSYRAVGCSGIARVDLLINKKTNTVYFNEINPLPGSLYSHNWRASGVSSIDLVENLIKLAEENFAKKQKLTTTFTTNFLKQF